MDERETVRSLGWSHRSVTRRVAFGALAGGMITAAELETGQARTKKRAQAAAKPSAAAERQRPISEFVTAQGSTTQFVPPVPDVLGWATFSDDPVLFAWVDYAGVADEFLHGALGTATSGNVIEQPQKDGRAKVHVSLHTRNALAWVIDSTRRRERRRLRPDRQQEADLRLPAAGGGRQAPGLAGRRDAGCGLSQHRARRPTARPSGRH